MTHLSRRLVAAALTVLAISATGAAAEPLDTRAITAYAAVALDMAGDNLARATRADGNVTCDADPVVDGRMLLPRAPVVVGEVYAHAVVAAHLKCVSLDPSLEYWLHGTVVDMFWDGVRFRENRSAETINGATAGVTHVEPFDVMPYRPSDGLNLVNTWHYAYFVGRTSTGQVVQDVSPLFYVAAL